MNVFEDSDPSLSGLEQLRALIAAGRRPPIFETLGFDLTEAHEGRVIVTGRPSPRVYNPIGSVHGGFAAAMLDSACGCAVHSKLSPAQAYTTLELKISFIRALSADVGPVHAEGIVLSVGRRVGFSEAKITDADGRLYASASSTCLIFDRNR
jgi:uncharacterized protein (TIGR00369 family)